MSNIKGQFEPQIILHERGILFTRKIHTPVRPGSTKPALNTRGSVFQRAFSNRHFDNPSSVVSNTSCTLPRRLHNYSDPPLGVFFFCQKGSIISGLGDGFDIPGNQAMSTPLFSAADVASSMEKVLGQLRDMMTGDDVSYPPHNLSLGE